MTNILEEVKKRPKTLTAGVTATAVIGFFFAWNSLSPTFEFVVRLQKAPSVAEAALQKATEAREWIDAYIEQQKQQQALEQQRYELEQEFKKRLFEMQSQQSLQQQAPNQMYRPQAPQPVPQPIPPIPHPPTTLKVEWAQDEYGNWYCTDGRESWWPNEDGYCD